LVRAASQRKTILGGKAASLGSAHRAGQFLPVSRCFARLGVPHFLALWMIAAAVLAFAPSSCHAGLIFSSETQGPSSDETGLSIWQDSSSSSDSHAPVVPAEPVAPEKQALPDRDFGLNGGDGGTTSSPPVSGVGSAPVALATEAFRLVLSGDASRIRLLVELGFDSPPPRELLDPPKCETC
jgi:hypothetical protein